MRIAILLRKIGAVLLERRGDLKDGRRDVLCRDIEVLHREDRVDGTEQRDGKRQLNGTLHAPECSNVGEHHLGESGCRVLVIVQIRVGILIHNHGCAEAENGRGSEVLREICGVAAEFAVHRLRMSAEQVERVARIIEGPDHVAACTGRIGAAQPHFPGVRP